MYVCAIHIIPQVLGIDAPSYPSNPISTILLSDADGEIRGMPPPPTLPVQPRLVETKPAISLICIEKLGDVPLAVMAEFEKKKWRGWMLLNYFKDVFPIPVKETLTIAVNSGMRGFLHNNVGCPIVRWKTVNKLKHPW